MQTALLIKVKTMKIYKIILRKTLAKPAPKTDTEEEKGNHSVRPKNEYMGGGYAGATLRHICACIPICTDVPGLCLCVCVSV